MLHHTQPLDVDLPPPLPSLADDLPPLPPPPRRSIRATCTNCGATCLHLPHDDGLSGDDAMACSECGWTIKSSYEAPKVHSKEALRMFSQSTKARGRAEHSYADLQAMMLRRRSFADFDNFSKPPHGGMTMQTMDAVQRARSVAMQRMESDKLVKALDRAGVSVAPRAVERALCLPPDRSEAECRLMLPRGGAVAPPVERPRRSLSPRVRPASSPPLSRKSAPKTSSKPASSSAAAAASKATPPAPAQPQPRREPLSMARAVRRDEQPAQRWQGGKLNQTTRQVLEHLSAQAANNPAVRDELHSIFQSATPRSVEHSTAAENLSLLSEWSSRVGDGAWSPERARTPE